MNTNYVDPSDADHDPDGMILWECKYTATCKHFTDRCLDYWWSTTPITLHSIETQWKIINPNIKITDFSCNVSPVNNGRFTIVERKYNVLE